MSLSQALNQFAQNLGRYHLFISGMLNGLWSGRRTLNVQYVPVAF